MGIHVAGFAEIIPRELALDGPLFTSIYIILSVKGNIILIWNFFMTKFIENIILSCRRRILFARDFWINKPQQRVKRALLQRISRENPGKPHRSALYKAAARRKAWISREARRRRIYKKPGQHTAIRALRGRRIYARVVVALGRVLSGRNRAGRLCGLFEYEIIPRARMRHARRSWPGGPKCILHLSSQCESYKL